MIGQRVLVTGGAGFLGSHFVRQAVAAGAEKVVNVDRLTYAGDIRRLEAIENEPAYEHVLIDIASQEDVDEVLQRVKPELLVHFAAESHVTRSEKAPDLFHRTNLEGTRVLLESARKFGVRRFVHISTDEVYGPIAQGAFVEEDKLPGDVQASSPYAKSKAIADDLVRSYADRLEVVVARPTNAFGPYQYPEKAFARWVTRALRGEPLLVWGDGRYIRQWLFAQDLAEAVALLSDVGEPGGTYNIGPRHQPEITNLELAHWLVDYVSLSHDQVRLTEYDRPDHDRRYSVDPTRIEQLGWRPGDTWAQFAATVDWYRDHDGWWGTLIGEAESIYIDAESSSRPG